MIELRVLMFFVITALGIVAPGVPITLRRDEPHVQGQADVQAALIGAAFGGLFFITSSFAVGIEEQAHKLMQSL